MTPSDRDPTTPEPLWTLERTLAFIAEHFGDEAEIAKPYAVIVASEIVYDYETECAELRAAATAALGWIDEIYPPDIFDGSSGDEGPVRIAAIRERLRWALRQLKEREP